VAVGAAVTFVAGAVLSAVTYDEVWSRNPARTYVTTAKAELTSLPPHTRLLDQTVPPDVLNALTAPRNTTAWLFAPLRNGPAFGETATDGWQVGEDGTVVRHEVTGIRSRPGPAEGCGWPVGRAGGSIRLGADLFSWPWVLRIDYLAGADTPAVLRLGSARTEATFTKGLGSLIVRLDGEGDRLRVDGLDPGTGLCIDTVKIGSLRAP
jgi:hypothetical protein